MIWRNFKARFGVVLGGAILALSLSCTSSNELADDPIVSSESDSIEATLEEGSTSEATVDGAAESSVDAAVQGGIDESFATAVVESATESPEARSPVSVNVTEATPEQPSVEIPVDLGSSIAALDGESSGGAEGFTPDVSTAGAESPDSEDVPEIAATSAEVVADSEASGKSHSDATAKSDSIKRSESSFVYTVKKGDWLSKVAIKVYGSEGSWQEIAEKNGLKDANKIEPGQKIVLEISNEASKKYSKAYGNVVYQKTSDYPSVQPNGLATIYAQPGDSLSKLAIAIYGSKENWKEIYALNKSHIADADLIFIKQKLNFKVQFPADTSYYDEAAH